jgi:nucleoside 2-deoxyribosyltransferase
MKRKIYLAGPDVFRTNAIEHMSKLKALCEQYGHIVLSPLDNEFIQTNNKLEDALSIFRGNIQQIDICDIIIANIQPFRGACIDDGTAGEILYGFAKGKIICGYSGFIDFKLSEIVAMFTPKLQNFDVFSIIENFNLSHNLMIVGAILDSGGFIAKTFEDILKLI